MSAHLEEAAGLIDLAITKGKAEVLMSTADEIERAGRREAGSAWQSPWGEGMRSAAEILRRRAFEISNGIDAGTIASLTKSYEDMRAKRDAAYHERNQVVAALAKAFPSGVAQHDPNDEKWDADRRTIVLIDLPTGQVSWHFHDSERHLLDGLETYPGKWDGHDTPEKYRRLNALPVGP